MNNVQKQSKVNQEGWDLITKEGDGIGVTTAWGVAVNGEINPWKVYPTRRIAREERNELSELFDKNKYNVRKLEIRVVEGR